MDDLVASIVRERFSDIDLEHSRLLRGQHAVVVVGSETVLRVPRHEKAAGRLRRLERLAKLLQGRLPLAISEPTVLEEPRSPGGVVSVERRIEGNAISLAGFQELSRTTQRAVAEQLAEFLTALHRISPEDAEQAGVERKVPSQHWGAVLGRARELFSSLVAPEVMDLLEARFSRFLNESAPGLHDLVLIHGDFGPSNVLFSQERGCITGVVDFEFSSIDDAAYDLASISTLGAGVLDDVTGHLNFKGRVAERIEFYRFTFPLQEALFAADAGSDQAVAAALEAYSRYPRPSSSG